MKHRDIQITVRVPKGAKWQTTDRDGTICWWNTEPEQYDGIWWGRYGNRMYPGVETGIPCRAWKKSKVELK